MPQPADTSQAGSRYGDAGVFVLGMVEATTGLEPV
jgi:hypothetical protein